MFAVKKNNGKIQLIIISLLLLITSCVTMQDMDFSSIDFAISRCDYDSARSILENNKSTYYSNSEKVLEYLDSGILSHFSGEFKKSNDSLSAAETKIAENFTKSVSQQIGKALINDNVADYCGEVYEDIYTNILMCLNYIQMKNLEDAMVEIRRFDNKMKVVGSEYQALIDSQKSSLTTEYNYSDFSSVDTKVSFHNCAFARYLSMLLYRTQGDISQAKVDYKKIKEAFSNQPSIYDFAAPSDLINELKVTEDDARLNVVCFTGKCPVKIEQAIRIPFRGAYYKLALPFLTKRSSDIRAVQTVIKSLDTGTVYKVNLHCIEKIENIATDTYKQHYGSIYARTVMRSIGKSVTSGVLSTASALSNDKNVRLALGLLSLASQVSTEVSERADVRVCRYFPGKVNVAGITLPDGKYEISVNYYNSNKKKIFTNFIPEYEVRKGRLNLVESVFQN